MISRLSDADRHAALATLAPWTYLEERRAIFRQIVTSDFAEAMGLMVRIGIEADKANHHPEWFNVYNKIDIWLTTHDAGGVSARDIDLATRIEHILQD